MIFRRIFAGWIVALLLSTSALAAACDVSCAFAGMNSDCHAKLDKTQAGTPGGMKMDGMAMAGMNMPDSAGRANQQSTSGRVESKPSHPQIGEMGPCERQSCGGDPAISARSACSGNRQLRVVLACPETPRTNVRFFPFHDARDTLLTAPIIDASHLLSTLRI
jgi:hypothetical protein